MGVFLEQLDFTPQAFRLSQADGITSWYAAGGADIVSATSSVTVGNLHAVPFWTGFGGTIDQIAFNVTAGGSAGSVARCGLYDADPNTLYPRTLLVDGGEFATTGTGLMNATLSQPLVLKRGALIYTAYMCGVASPTCTAYSSGWHLMGRNGSFQAQFGFSAVGVGYGQLPAAYPSGAAILNSGGSSPIMVAVRYQSYPRALRLGE